MSENTNISWCDSTVNFWSGCTRVSAGCSACYAETLASRSPATFGQWGPGKPRRLHESAFALSRRLNNRPWVCDGCGRGFKAITVHECGNDLDVISAACLFHKRRIFSLSMGDIWDPEVPIEWLARMLDTIRQCDQVDWLLCTKRPEKWMQRIELALGWFRSDEANRPQTTAEWLHGWLDGIPRRNIWTLTSIEDQRSADQRIPHALAIPSVCRGLSIEPLLGPIDLNGIPLGDGDTWHLSGTVEAHTGWPDSHLRPIHWLIIGGESGPKARPCNVWWVRDLVRQGKAAGVPVFVKQLGSIPDFGCIPDPQGGIPITFSIHDSKGGDPDEWPADLRVRKWPSL